MKDLNEFDILRELGWMKSDRAIINNIKTNNNNKNFTDDTQLSDNQQSLGYAPSSGETSSLSQKEASSDAKGLVEQAAAPWRYIKLDLFNNANPADLLKGKSKMRLNIAMLIGDNSDYHRVMASLNTDFRFLKRGLNFTDTEDLAHYEAVAVAYKELNDNSIEKVRASKCYLKNTKGKGKSVPGMSVILKPNIADGDYDVVVVYETDYHTYKLSSKQLTAKQRQGNMIASGQWGQKMDNRIRAKDLFKLPPQG